MSSTHAPGGRERTFRRDDGSAPVGIDVSYAIQVPIGAVDDAGYQITVDLSGVVTAADESVYDAVVFQSDTGAVPIPIQSLPDVIRLLASAGEHAGVVDAR